jgi:hypothetical protein
MDSLEQVLTDLIELRRRKGNGSDVVEAPIIGEVYTAEGVESIKRKITLAIAAQIRWDKHKPPSLPALPLSLAQIRALMGSWRHLLALYAYSWRKAGWDPEHPPFDEFTAGLLASPRVPWYLKNAVGLSEVKPKPLAALDDETFCWDPKQLLIKQKIAELQAGWARENPALPLPDDTHLALRPSIYG